MFNLFILFLNLPLLNMFYFLMFFFYKNIFDRPNNVIEKRWEKIIIFILPLLGFIPKIVSTETLPEKTLDVYIKISFIVFLEEFVFNKLIYIFLPYTINTLIFTNVMFFIYLLNYYNIYDIGTIICFLILNFMYSVGSKKYSLFELVVYKLKFVFSVLKYNY